MGIRDPQVAMMHGGGGPPPMMWMWGGRRRKPDSGPANSGITGDRGLEEAPEQEGPKDLRGRWLIFRQSVTGTLAALPQVTRVVWDASPCGTLGLTGAPILAGLPPGAS